ncbi:hypothetical protein [Nocardioides okcheonensis]|uniref:hypothetical protein n=1 Tax=Nocardioides okcheonensis TaxID=2894081 RepID=UPI001E3AFE0C|nr:hypothetical protein [Nocardioides okcheonensis]UFN46155.1 hypothetical protein LN652_08130 [Nocardioides okcheonensis]
MYLAFPFVLGFLLIAAQPLLDDACECVLERLQYDWRAIEAAKWTGATAAFLPAAVLTAYGALVIMSDEGGSNVAPGLLLWSTGLLVLAMILFLYAVVHSGPAVAWQWGPTAKFQYTFLQLVLAGLNVVGVGFAVWYR